MPTHERTVEGAILDTIDTFLDTCPDLEDASIQALPVPPDVEFLTVFDGETRYYEVNGRHYKVTVMGEEA